MNTPLDTLSPLSKMFYSPKLSDDLVSYYKFDEVSGVEGTSYPNAICSAGSGNTLLPTVSVPTSAAGKIGTSRQFTRASSQAFNLSGNTNLNLSSDIGVTIAFWCYLDTKVNDYTFVGRGSNTTSTTMSYWIHYAVASDRIRAQWSNGSAVLTCVASTFGAVPVGEMLFVIAFIDRTPSQTARGGIRIGRNTTLGPIDYNISAGYATSLNPTAFTFSVGAIGNARYFNGRVDELGLWKRRLSDNEHVQLFNGGNGLSYPF